MESTNKAQQAYDAIEQMIVFQELAPGSLVSEARLMDRTGLGRTPVREALQRLARDHLVEIHASRGVLVPPTSIEAQLKLLELRRTLESLAVQLAADRADTMQKSQMLSLAEDLTNLEPATPREFAALLKRAHESIAAAAQNEFLETAMAPLQGLSRRFWFAHIVDADEELGVAAKLHRDILISISRGDEQEAISASIALNDYLVNFAYETLPRTSSRGSAHTVAQHADGNPSHQG